jgi:hypothetical protein
MIKQISFRRIWANRALTTALSVSALVLIAVVTFYPERLSHAANHKRQQLTFEDRVEAQRAIEAVYWRRRVWPEGNPQPKPPLDQVLPDEAIRAKVEDYLRKTAALEAYWRRSITPDELQADLDRMARDTKQPDALRELWAFHQHEPSGARAARHSVGAGRRAEVRRRDAAIRSRHVHDSGQCDFGDDAD